jgi:hypothetical protein
MSPPPQYKLHINAVLVAKVFACVFAFILLMIVCVSALAFVDCRRLDNNNSADASDNEHEQQCLFWAKMLVFRLLVVARIFAVFTACVFAYFLCCDHRESCCVSRMSRESYDGVEEMHEPTPI